MANKPDGVVSWFTNTTERRPIRRHSRLGLPDVHPQEHKQEEDLLPLDRLRKGYQLPVTGHEHESLVHRARSAQLEKIDDASNRSASLFSMLTQRKGEFSTVLDKERKKLKEATPSNLVNARAKELLQWFIDLAKGRSLSYLAKKVPTFKNKEEALDAFCDYKVNNFRVVWYMKITAALTGAHTTQKSKRSTTDIFSADYAQVLNRILREILKGIWNVEDLLQCSLYTDRWKYFTHLSKYSFEEGVIEKQEYLNELCELFIEFFIRYDHGEEKESQLRIFLIFFAQFAKFINMNLLLARRTAHMICQKLEFFHMEYCDRFGETPAAIVYERLAECEANRTSIHILTSLLHNIIIESPSSLIWNKFKIDINRGPYILTQLSGCPLDLIACDVSELPMPEGPDRENMKELVSIRSQEIVRRSTHVHNLWSTRLKVLDDHMFILEEIIRTIEQLDTCFLDHERLADILTKQIFVLNRKWDQLIDEEFSLKVRVLFHWSVTIEREESHRPLLVALILKNLVEDHPTLAENYVQTIFLSYMKRDAPKPGAKNYAKEFSALIALFIELSRFQLFDHDKFVSELIRVGDLSISNPIYSKLRPDPPKPVEPPPIVETTPTVPPDPSIPPVQPSVSSAPTATLEMVDDDISVITYTTPAVPPESSPKVAVKEATPEPPPPPPPPKPIKLVTHVEESPDTHDLLYDEMTPYERIIVQMPLRQHEKFRNAANQRTMILYGSVEKYETHKANLKKLARKFCEVWHKKIYTQFYTDKTDVWCPRRMNSDQVNELMRQYKALTYYDQFVICGWCSESIIDMVRQFVHGDSKKMPTSESVDLICSMYEQASDVNGLCLFAEAFLPNLENVEKVIRAYASDCIPGSMACQLAYVFACYLSKHFHFYLHSGFAVSITNAMFLLVEKMIRAQEYPQTCWGRAVSAFVCHSKVFIRRAKVRNYHLLTCSGCNFKKVANIATMAGNPVQKYNSKFFKDEFIKDKKVKLRFFSYHEYKKRLPSFQIDSNRYSFVINAIVKAKDCGRDFEQLSEMATFCAHISSQFPLIGDDWILAMKALCSHKSSGNGYKELLEQIDVSDTSTHYPIATFMFLLATKYAVCVTRLACEVLGGQLTATAIKNIGPKYENNTEYGSCLALLLISQLCCATDEPFVLAPNYLGKEKPTKLFPRYGDESFLCLMHWCELDNVLFSILCSVGILQDTLRNRHRDLDLKLPKEFESTKFRKEYLMNMVVMAQTMIVEQRWVTEKVFFMVVHRKEAFNQERLRQNCLGQQMQRSCTRRSSEREIVRELAICNGNSKKSLIDKLLSVMSTWNIRSTLHDIKLMIKEIVPEGSQKHAQQGAIAADALIGEIGKCCREMFASGYKAFLANGTELPTLGDNIIGLQFDFINLSKYWLISPLLRSSPNNLVLPASFPTTSVAGKFLKEAAAILDPANDNSKDKFAQGVWLLSQEPFVYAIITCMKTEISQGQLDVFSHALHKQMNEIVLRVKETPSRFMKAKHASEREALLLRFNLVGVLFPQICKASICDSWALLFFQMMLYGVVTQDRERILYDTCFDMLSTLMLYALTDSVNICEGPKFRWPVYTQIIKRLKKEASECTRVPPDLRCLLHFLPIPKNSIDILATESYGSVVNPATRQTRPIPLQPRLGIRTGRYSAQPSEVVRATAYDFIPGYIHDRGGFKWSWFTTTRLERVPILLQRNTQKLSPHENSMVPQRPAVIISDGVDLFLTAPVGEPISEPIPSPSTSAASMFIGLTPMSLSDIRPEPEPIREEEEPRTPTTPAGLRTEITLSSTEDIASIASITSINSDISTSESTPILTETDGITEMKAPGAPVESSPQGPKGGRGRRRGGSLPRGGGSGRTKKSGREPTMRLDMGMGGPMLQPGPSGSMWPDRQQMPPYHPYNAPPIIQTISQPIGSRDMTTSSHSESRDKIRSALKSRIEIKSHQQQPSGFPGPSATTPSTVVPPNLQPQHQTFGSDASQKQSMQAPSLESFQPPILGLPSDEIEYSTSGASSSSAMSSQMPTLPYMPPPYNYEQHGQPSYQKLHYESERQQLMRRQAEEREKAYRENEQQKDLERQRKEKEQYEMIQQRKREREEREREEREKLRKEQERVAREKMEKEKEKEEQKKKEKLAMDQKKQMEKEQQQREQMEQMRQHKMRQQEHLRQIEQQQQLAQQQQQQHLVQQQQHHQQQQGQPQQMHPSQSMQYDYMSGDYQRPTGMAVTNMIPSTQTGSYPQGMYMMNQMQSSSNMPSSSRTQAVGLPMAPSDVPSHLIKPQKKSNPKLKLTMPDQVTKSLLQAGPMIPMQPQMTQMEPPRHQPPGIGRGVQPMIADQQRNQMRPENPQGYQPQQGPSMPPHLMGSSSGMGMPSRPSGNISSHLQHTQPIMPPPQQTIMGHPQMGHQSHMQLGQHTMGQPPMLDNMIEMSGPQMQQQRGMSGQMAPTTYLGVSHTGAVQIGQQPMGQQHHAMGQTSMQYQQYQQQQQQERAMHQQNMQQQGNQQNPQSGYPPHMRGYQQ